MKRELNLTPAQMEKLTSAYTESLAQSYTETHCQHHSKSKTKPICNRELVNGACPIHKEDIYPPAPKPITAKCDFPTASGACGRSKIDSEQYCGFHKGKTPMHDKQNLCEFVFKAGERKGKVCGKAFSDHRVPGEDMYSEEYTQMMNKYCQTHCMAMLLADTRKASKEEDKSEPKPKESEKKTKTSKKKSSDDEDSEKKKSKKSKKKSSDDEESKKKKSKKSKKKSSSDDEESEKKPSDDEKDVEKNIEDSDLDSDLDEEEFSFEEPASAKASPYPHIDFSFDDKDATYTGMPITINGDKAKYLRIKAKYSGGVSKLTPIIVDREIAAKTHILEMLGYTTDLLNSSINESEFHQKYHPLMDQFKEIKGDKCRFNYSINQ
jgi:hypothetical protein